MFQSSWWEITTHIISLAIAYALALPVGWDRENDARSAGISTFPLVAIASCGVALVGIAILGRTTPAQARLLDGLITGVRSDERRVGTQCIKTCRFRWLQE